eukprot:6506009-Prymnesium_polylepis.1
MALADVSRWAGTRALRLLRARRLAWPWPVPCSHGPWPRRRQQVGICAPHALCVFTLRPCRFALES